MLKNYNTFHDEMILRDYLALDRTILANERTLLSYLRACIGAFAAGIALVKLLDSLATNILGIIFIAVSPVFLVIGIVRFIQVQRKLRTIDQPAKRTGDQPAGSESRMPE